MAQSYVLDYIHSGESVSSCSLVSIWWWVDFCCFACQYGEVLQLQVENAHYKRLLFSEIVTTGDLGVVCFYFQPEHFEFSIIQNIENTLICFTILNFNFSDHIHIFIIYSGTHHLNTHLSNITTNLNWKYNQIKIFSIFKHIILNNKLFFTLKSLYFTKSIHFVNYTKNIEK